MVAPDELAEQPPCHTDSQRLVEMRDDLDRLARRTESAILAKYYRAICRLLEHGAMLSEGEAGFESAGRSDEVDRHLVDLLERSGESPKDIPVEDEVVIALITETVTSETPADTEVVLEQLRQADASNRGGDA